MNIKSCAVLLVLPFLTACVDPNWTDNYDHTSYSHSSNTSRIYHTYDYPEYSAFSSSVFDNPIASATYVPHHTARTSGFQDNAAQVQLNNLRFEQDRLRRQMAQDRENARRAEWAQVRQAQEHSRVAQRNQAAREEAAALQASRQRAQAWQAEAQQRAAAAPQQAPDLGVDARSISPQQARADLAREAKLRESARRAEERSRARIQREGADLN